MAGSLAVPQRLNDFVGPTPFQRDDRTKARTTRHTKFDHGPDSTAWRRAHSGTAIHGSASPVFSLDLVHPGIRMGEQSIDRGQRGVIDDEADARGDAN
jgi:hypothetical protein